MTNKQKKKTTVEVFADLHDASTPSHDWIQAINLPLLSPELERVAHSQSSGLVRVRLNM